MHRNITIPLSIPLLTHVFILAFTSIPNSCIIPQFILYYTIFLTLISDSPIIRFIPQLLHTSFPSKSHYSLIYIYSIIFCPFLLHLFILLTLDLLFLSHLPHCLIIPTAPQSIQFTSLIHPHFDYPIVQSINIILYLQSIHPSFTPS